MFCGKRVFKPASFRKLVCKDTDQGEWDRYNVVLVPAAGCRAIVGPSQKNKKINLVLVCKRLLICTKFKKKAKCLISQAK